MYPLTDRFPFHVCSYEVGIMWLPAWIHESCHTHNSHFISFPFHIYNSMLYVSTHRAIPISYFVTWNRNRGRDPRYPKLRYHTRTYSWCDKTHVPHIYGAVCTVYIWNGNCTLHTHQKLRYHTSACFWCDMTHVPHIHDMLYILHTFIFGIVVATPVTQKCDIMCVAVCCSVLQCVAVCCSVLQCVAVCCSVL